MSVLAQQCRHTRLAAAASAARVLLMLIIDEAGAVDPLQNVFVNVSTVIRKDYEDPLTYHTVYDQIAKKFYITGQVVQQTSRGLVTFPKKLFFNSQRSSKPV